MAQNVVELVYLTQLVRWKITFILQMRQSSWLNQSAYFNAWKAKLINMIISSRNVIKNDSKKTNKKKKTIYIKYI